MIAPVTIEAIKRQVSRYYGIRPQEFTSRRREHRVARPRQVAMYLAHIICQKENSRRYSKSNIGRQFGGRDHSTVFHAIRAVRQRIATDDAELAKLMAVVIDLHLEESCYFRSPSDKTASGAENAR